MSELKDKMLLAINSKAVITNKGTGDDKAAELCASIAIQDKIDTIERILKETDNSRADYYFGLELDKLKSLL